MLNHKIENSSNGFKEEKHELQTEWSSVFRFGLIFAFYTYYKCYFFFEYGIYFDLFSEITGIILMLISIPFEMSLTILLLRIKHLNPSSVHMFITCSIYLVFAYSFAITRPFDMSFSSFLNRFNPVMIIQSMATIALYSIPISIVTISLVNFIIKNYELRKSWYQNKSSRS